MLAQKQDELVRYVIGSIFEAADMIVGFNIEKEIKLYYQRIVIEEQAMQEHEFKKVLMEVGKRYAYH